MFSLIIRTLKIFCLVWHENAIFRILEFLDFSNQVEDKMLGPFYSRQKLYIRSPWSQLDLPIQRLGLGEIVCDNMMTIAKAVDFPVVEKYLSTSR